MVYKNKRQTTQLAGFDTNMYVETRPYQCHIAIHLDYVICNVYIH